MTEEELKKITDEIYNIGFKNGGIEMKNKILKTINRVLFALTLSGFFFRHSFA